MVVITLHMLTLTKHSEDGLCKHCISYFVNPLNVYSFSQAGIVKIQYGLRQGKPYVIADEFVQQMLDASRHYDSGDCLGPSRAVTMRLLLKHEVPGPIQSVRKTGLYTLRTTLSCLVLAFAELISMTITIVYTLSSTG